MKLILPLRVYISQKKQVSANLNWYRRAHFKEIHRAEVAYKEQVLGAIVDAGMNPRTFKLTPPLRLIYTLYPKNNQRMDVGNVLPVVQKFTDDALVELGFMPDDDWSVIREVVHKFGYVDPDNPRAELEFDEFRGDPDTDRQRRFDFAH